MERFFGTKEGFLPRTYILVVKDTPSGGAGSENSGLTSESWQMQGLNCRMGWISRNVRVPRL
jgi:hypothetical protein